MLNNNKLELNQVENLILSTLEEITKEYLAAWWRGEQKGLTWLTTKFKEKVGSIGESEGYSVSSSKHGGEWLYDLMWYKNDENDNLKEVFLVAESEISSSKEEELLYDFEKLLLANANMRVMFCLNEPNNRYPDNLNRRFEFFNKSVKAYSLLPKGSRVLVLIWDDWNHGEIHPHLIIV